jgi:hypothetical protein
MLKASMIAWRTSDVSLFVEPFFRPDPGRLPPRGMFENPSIFSKTLLLLPLTIVGSPCPGRRQ